MTRAEGGTDMTLLRSADAPPACPSAEPIADSSISRRLIGAASLEVVTSHLQRPQRRRRQSLRLCPRSCSGPTRTPRTNGSLMLPRTTFWRCMGSGRGTHNGVARRRVTRAEPALPDASQEPQRAAASSKPQSAQPSAAAKTASSRSPRCLCNVGCSTNVVFGIWDPPEQGRP